MTPDDDGEWVSACNPLVEAAPDMLAALKTAKRMLDKWIDEDCHCGEKCICGWIDVVRGLNRIRAALAKVEAK
jgi:hypothetical protein